MKTRHLAFASAFIGRMSAATTAEALVGQLPARLTCCTGPGTAYPAVMTIPTSAGLRRLRQFDEENGKAGVADRQPVARQTDASGRARKKG